MVCSALVPKPPEPLFKSKEELEQGLRKSLQLSEHGQDQTDEAAAKPAERGTLDDAKSSKTALFAEQDVESEYSKDDTSDVATPSNTGGTPQTAKPPMQNDTSRRASPTSKHALSEHADSRTQSLHSSMEQVRLSSLTSSTVSESSIAKAAE